ncbi:unnamed protein product [Rotaria sordida]|uniref:Uncharacterized protein n=1 Tax=Rotaria sordida TaxID=392033 RepID=A0A818W763_9BILA|nr:unnamed protein product [Rotaria sordida]
MATTAGKTTCVKCKEPKNTVKCAGCFQEFCLNHMFEHHKELSEQLDAIEHQFNEFKIEIDGQKVESQKHELIEQIDKWERESIEKIRQVANDARNELTSCVTTFFTDVDLKLKQLTERLINCRKEEDFIDTDVYFFDEELKQLKDTLNNPSNFKIEQQSTSFLNKICLTMRTPFLCNATVNVNVKWKQNGVTVAGGNGSGSGMNQLHYAQGLYVDDDQTIYIADGSNHRIVEWKYGATTGRIVAGGNGQGNHPDQLDNPSDVIIDKEGDFFIICDRGNKRVVRWPRQNGENGETIISNVGCWGLTIDDDGFLYIADHDKHEVRRYRIGESQGKVVAGGNGSGNRLDQLTSPKYLFVDRDHSVYVSDSFNHRVMKWMEGEKEGIVVAGGQGHGNSLTQLNYPQGVVVDQTGTVYIADDMNHRIMRWFQGATEGNVIVGGNGEGSQPNQLYYPTSLSFDREGNLYVSDPRNHRVQKFNIDQN